MNCCDRVVVRAPGKVNLSLDITGRDSDGYHLLSGVMLAVDLGDLLLISRRKDGEIRVICPHPEVPSDRENIAYTAAREFFAHSGVPAQGLTILIDKAIPVQAGLGGGSSDAAGVLVGLDRMFSANLGKRSLCGIGERVGSDVPFCVMGGCALAEGRGEKLTPLPVPARGRLVIAKPAAGMSTRRAFRMYDERETAGGHAVLDSAAMMKAVAAGDLDGVGAGMQNALERVCPVKEVFTLKEAMLDCGALGAVMSGSGTAVVGLFAQRSPAERCLSLLSGSASEVFLAAPAEFGANVVYEE